MDVRVGVGVRVAVAAVVCVAVGAGPVDVAVADGGLVAVTVGVRVAVGVRVTVGVRVGLDPVGRLVTVATVPVDVAVGGTGPARMAFSAAAALAMPLPQFEVLQLLPGGKLFAELCRICRLCCI